MDNSENSPVGPDGKNKNSMKFDTSVSGGCTGVYQIVNGLQANQAYTASIWLKKASDNNSDVKVRIGLIGQISTNESDEMPLTGEWVRYQFDVTPTSDTIRGMQFRCTTTGATYWAWGAQLNVGNLLRSYVTTADGQSSPFDTLYFE